MLNYLFSLMVNIIGRRIGIILNIILVIFTMLLIYNNKNINKEILIFNFLLINVGLLMLKMNNKML